jgi:hypothetical protein
VRSPLTCSLPRQSLRLLTSSPTAQVTFSIALRPKRVSYKIEKSFFPFDTHAANPSVAPMNDPASPPAIPRRTRPKLADVIAVLVLVAAPVTLFCAYRVSLWIQVKGRLDGIRESGYPVTLAELNKWYAEVPSNENAATILTNAFALIVQGDTNSTTLPFIGKAKWPARDEPLSEEMKKAIVDHLTLNGKALGLLHDGAQLQRCRYPIDFELGYNAPIRHVAQLRPSVQLLMLAAALDIEEANSEAAVVATIDALRVGDSVSNEPLDISQVGRMLGERLIFSGLERFLSRRSLADEQLARLFSAFEASEASVNSARSYAGEICARMHVFHLPAYQILEIEKEVTLSTADYSTVSKPEAQLYGGLMRIGGANDRDLLYFLETTADYLEAIKSPYPQRIKACEGLQPRFRRVPVVKGFVISRMLLPTMSLNTYREARHIATLRAAEIALAVERFRFKNENRLPESLKDLVPEFVKEVPPDPYDGKSLRYRKLAKGYVVYSIADNGRDDGGAEWRNPKDFAGPPGERRGYDWTFTVER